MRRTKLAVIYIPGLGDQNPRFQSLAVKSWKIYGYKSQLIQMFWDDDMPFSKKLPKIIKAIDDLSSKGYKVALVGASAGASAVINAYVARKEKVIAVALIAAKINRPDTLGDKYHKDNPSFVESINQAQQSLNLLDESDKEKIICIYSPKDGLVAPQDSIIKGAKVHRTLVPYHPLVIGYFITFGFYTINKFIRTLTKGV